MSRPCPSESTVRSERVRRMPVPYSYRHDGTERRAKGREQRANARHSGSALVNFSQKLHLVRWSNSLAPRAQKLSSIRQSNPRCAARGPGEGLPAPCRSRGAGRAEAPVDLVQRDFPEELEV